MTFRDIQSAVKVFYPAIALDGMFSRHARGITLKLLGAVQAMAFLVWVVVEFILPAGVAGGAEALVAAKGVFFVLLPFTLLIFLQIHTAVSMNDDFAINGERVYNRSPDTVKAA